ncbi:MAG: MarR family winged helix-turn-helix transcriptional regulator [Sneathiella sp.]
MIMENDLPQSSSNAGISPESGPEALDQIEMSFGVLSRSLLEKNPILDLWRISFLANFYNEPFYKTMEENEGISRSEFLVLFCLNSRQGITAREICLATGRPRNSVSRAVARLRKMKLITYSVSEDDRRRKILQETDQGRALLDRVVPVAVARMKVMMSPLSPKENKELNRLLTKLIRNVPTWAFPE